MAQYHYRFLPDDGVFYWDDVEAADTPSFTYGHVSSNDLISVMIQTEFVIGPVYRTAYVRSLSNSFSVTSKALGLQIGAGPRLKFGPATLYTLGGLNVLHVTEEEDSISSGGSGRIVWVGVSGISRYWAALYNQIPGSRQSGTFTFPSYSRRSPSATLGASIDIGRIRLTAEEVRVFASPARTDRRLGLGFTF
jgi:hypothetical protein